MLQNDENLMELSRFPAGDRGVKTPSSGAAVECGEPFPRPLPGPEPKNVLFGDLGSKLGKSLGTESF